MPSARLTKFHIGNWKKAHLRRGKKRMAFVQKTFWMNLTGTKKSLNKQTAGGVLTLLTSASFFSCSIQQLWFYISKSITVAHKTTHSLADSQKGLWMFSTFRCESSTPRYPHQNIYVTVNLWSWLLGLLDFSEWLPFQENIHPLQQAGTVKCYKVVVMWKMGRRWLLQS